MPTTSAKTIEFCFDFGSPTTYLAHTQLPRIASETGARVDYVPMLLGGVFKATGNQSPVMVPLQMRRPDRFMPYVDAVFHAMWVEPVNMGDPTTVAATLQAAGFDAGEFMALVGDAEVKAKLIANTEAAVARGVFGAPTCFVGQEMFFGQDRLDFVREAVAG
jgi:2-hydroxychromene-2-carboxylate isomerase